MKWLAHNGMFLPISQLVLASCADHCLVAAVHVLMKRLYAYQEEDFP